MDNSSVDTQNNGQDGEVSSPDLRKGNNLSSGNDEICAESKSKRLERRVNSQETLVFMVKKLRRSKSCIKESFVRSTHALDGWIPKHVGTLDEKYLHQCLDFIHESASKAAPRNISLNLGWENISSLSGGLRMGLFGLECVHDFSSFDYDYPLAGGMGNVVISAAGQWIVGSIMGSKSMKSILKSPIIRQCGELDGDTTFKKTIFNEVEGPASYTLTNSPEVFISCSSCKIDKEAPNPRRYKNGSQAAVEHNASMSSTNSTISDQSFPSLSCAVTRGMLQCIWKGADPHFVFSLDDEKVIYLANLEKDKSIDNVGLDYVYLFHSRVAGHNSESHVGKMMVSTSFTFCNDQSRIMEREFVLFGGSDNLVGEVHTSNHDLRRNKGLSKKVVEVFRTNPSMKKRTLSRFGGSNDFLDNYSSEPSCGTESNIEVLAEAKTSENYLPQNLQLAAIVVKDHLSDNYQEKVGGWGLKFLKKAGMTQKTDHSKSTPSVNSNQDTDNCSTSMDILVPAGFHGGPRTRNGGPSSLIERWKSGGCCDCGGWDLGCPLTVFKGRSNNKEISSHTNMQGECNLIELFIQGSKDTAPSLRMVNVHDGLYFVHFQSKLSALQSFSIAVAIIHSQTAALQPKNVQVLS